MRDDHQHADASFAVAVLKMLGRVVFAFAVVPASALVAYFLVFYVVAVAGSYGHDNLWPPFLSGLVSGVAAGLLTAYGVVRLFRRS